MRVDDIWPDFSRRSRRDEWMEAPGVPEHALIDSLDAIERLSRWTRASRASRRGLEALVGPEHDSLSILDVGTGNGAMAREFVEWGRTRDLAVEVFGIDILSTAVRYARDTHSESGGLHFARKNLLEMSGTDRFDVVHASLVLHHFRRPDLTRALDKMAELGRVGVVINDLHRHPLHWLGSKILIPLVTGSQIAIHDGPVSVLRGFRRRELVDLARRSNLSRATVQWQFPFRWLLVGAS